VCTLGPDAGANHYTGRVNKTGITMKFAIFHKYTVYTEWAEKLKQI